ncbi:MAG TPA: GTPase domain-containing protein, partial [Thermoanaerobaculia bacterium]
KVRVQLYTVPGQVFYDATRKLVLRGADGVVFVADSQSTMRESNLDSLENLRTNLRINRLDPDKVALVFQYNKRDLPNAASVEEMNAYLNPGNAPVVEAAAIQGVGVTATLRAAVAKILDNLKNNVDVTLYEEPPLAAPDMSQRAGVTTGSAGTPKLSMKTGEKPLRNTNTAPVALPPEVLDPPVASPFAADDASSPFEVSFDAIDAAVETSVDEDPFAAAPVADTSADRSELETMLANARSLIASLEIALDRAHENERMLTDKLARL